CCEGCRRGKPSSDHHQAGHQGPRHRRHQGPHEREGRRCVRTLRVVRRSMEAARADRVWRRRTCLRPSRGRRPLLARRGWLEEARADLHDRLGGTGLLVRRPLQLIINVDDIGLHPAVRRAVEACAARGTVTSASVLANGPDQDALR
ncbi:MAG: ChbG/HpnK family deacetylase, partial [bacterium]